MIGGSVYPFNFVGELGAFMIQKPLRGYHMGDKLGNKKIVPHSI
jgi:hypothetical protein